MRATGALPMTQIAPSSLAIALRQALLARDGADPGLRSGWGRGRGVRRTMRWRARSLLLGLRACSDAAGRLLLTHGNALATAWVALMLLAMAFGALGPAEAVRGDVP